MTPQVHRPPAHASRSVVVTDLAVAAVLLALAQSQVWLGWNDGGVGTVPAGHHLARGLLLVFTVGPLAWRRSHPLPAILAVCLAMVVQLLAVAPYLPLLGALLPMAVLNYSTAAYGARWRWMSLLLVVGTEAVMWTIPEERAQGEVIFSLFIALGTWVAGDVVRARLTGAERAVSSARVVVEASASRTAATLSEERARIARELHDVIAHSVGVMGVQAGAARTLLDAGDRTAAREAVQAIEDTARTSVSELQRLLGVLRGAEPVHGDRDPQPGLVRLEALVDQVRAAGVQVDLDLDPMPDLSPGLDLTAYRIVQESLTNVLKHAAPTSATVSVTRSGDHLLVVVCDQGGGPARGPATAGHGLIGMRERARLYGGHLEAGPIADGGFRVAVTLPATEPAPVAGDLA